MKRCIMLLDNFMGKIPYPAIVAKYIALGGLQ